jgi:hypothetical protein
MVEDGLVIEDMTEEVVVCIDLELVDFLVFW